MEKEVKQTEIKNLTFYFYSDVVSLENFDSNVTKGLIFTTLDKSQLKKIMIVKMFIV